jgi:hypothetical protein
MSEKIHGANSMAWIFFSVVRLKKISVVTRDENGAKMEETDWCHI